MFWSWNEGWKFMETEPGHHAAQGESLSQRLTNLTFWGNYGGDTFSRFHYELLLELYPDAVKSIFHSHGQSLVLDIGSGMTPQHVRGVVDFLAYFDHNSEAFGDYPIYEELGSYSDWEFELTQKEMTEGWWGENANIELVHELEFWGGNDLVPDCPTPEWGTLVYDYCSKDDWNGIETNWEGADSLVVHGWDTAEVAKWLLERYAASLTEKGTDELF